MIRKIDVNSEEFINELKFTQEYTNGVLQKHNLVYSPNNHQEEYNR